MKEQKKKRLIALLLFISCLISGYILLVAPGERAHQIHNLAQADSLIQKELSAFNISKQQIQISQTRVDSNFIRKTYHVGVPYQFSKTQFHAELNKRLFPYSIKVPARITFPQENMDIHLLHKNTVIRSISLQTDPDLAFNQNRISILVSFDGIPGKEPINQLKKLGEPIPIVLKITNAMQANEMKEKLESEYERIIFWLQNENGDDLIRVDQQTASNKLKQLQKVFPDAVVLHHNSSKQASVEDKKQLISETKMTFVDASNALILHEHMGKDSFFESLGKLRSKRVPSMAIITGNETTLTWLSQKLPELKKAGAIVTSPKKTNL